MLVQIFWGQEEVAILSKIVHSKTFGSSLRDRAQIVLGVSEGLTTKAITEKALPLFRVDANIRTSAWQDELKDGDPISCRLRKPHFERLQVVRKPPIFAGSEAVDHA